MQSRRNAHSGYTVTVNRPQPQENGDLDNFFTSHILYLQKSGGEGQQAIAFVTGTFYASKKVQWQVPLPDVPDVDLVATKTDGRLAAIIKKAVKEAFLVRCMLTT